MRKGIDRARKIGDVEEAANVLGNGSRVTAQDTVPFTLWGAAHHLDDYRAAFVGGVVTGPPDDWLHAGRFIHRVLSF
ncbi:hypothetical protein [Lentzea sp. HUAS12]|uniref:hypothetical protein n=1 Tax=Lentzea sp. HUAS12 TaxID=2951806 RepID=UPI00209EE592|nr:hypothetical protein [Lentzea sp. HUAS12]USX48183.1 hypothetical protein ND450_22065 [Lentzea sp. HUAS12]